MSIQDIQNQFKAEVDGTDLKLERAIMNYSEGGAVQTYEFRVSKNKGATTTIEVECRSFSDIPAIVKIAADKAKAWAHIHD